VLNITKNITIGNKVHIFLSIMVKLQNMTQTQENKIDRQAMIVEVLRDLKALEVGLRQEDLAVGPSLP